MENEWFTTWFNTPYYHLLYKHRDINEARSFIDRWVDTMRLPKGSHILDLACGRGRHAVHLHNHGYKVSGIDLSEENIDFANLHYKRDGLDFIRGDMRSDLGLRRYDAVVNLFTSFGYFDTPEENKQVFANIYRALKSGGVFLFDYLNPNAISEVSTTPETKHIEDSSFTIVRSIEGSHIVKSIRVHNNAIDKTFCEKVALIYPSEFYSMLTDCGFTLEEKWGDYQLNPLRENQSQRFITLASK